jgi:hypothetical protein
MNRFNGSLTEVNEAKVPEMRAALRAVLASHTFESRARLREFLAFVGNAALDGRAAEIKEQAIGVEVFGRASDYPVHDDTIVRVTARQLRQKLEEYAQTEGKGSAWVIEIPRGTYVPVFQQRELTENLLPEPGAAGTPRGVQETPAVETGALKSPTARSAFWAWAGWVVALALGAVVVALVMRQPGIADSPKEPTLLSLLQTAPGKRVSVVCGDAVVQVYKELVGDAPTVPEYENGSYLGHPVLRASVQKDSRLWDILHARQLVATGSVQALSRLVQAIPHGQVTVRHPRQVSVRDFVDDNVILLSGPFANPWVQLFEPKLNFRVVQDTNHVVYVQNVSPESGERAEYRNRLDGAKNITYARLAYMPNLGGKGRVLLIGGPSSPLMELIGSAASNPEFLRQLADRFGASDPEKLPFCEMLLEVEEIAGAPVTTRIVGARRVTARPEGLP